MGICIFFSFVLSSYMILYHWICHKSQNDIYCIVYDYFYLFVGAKEWIPFVRYCALMTMVGKIFKYILVR